MDCSLYTELLVHVLMLEDWRNPSIFCGSKSKIWKKSEKIDFKNPFQWFWSVPAQPQNHSFWPLSAVPGPMLVMFRGCKCPGWCLSRWVCYFGLKMMFGDFWPIFPWFWGGLEMTKMTQNHCVWPVSAVPGPMLVMFRGCKCPGGCLSRWICHFGLKMICLDFWPLFPLFLTLFIYERLRSKITEMDF